MTQEVDHIALAVDSFPQTWEMVEQLKSSGMQEYADALAAKIKEETNVTERILEKFITVDERMIAMKEKVKLLSKVQDPVLIFGQTGTGKELLAQALHGRRAGRFIPLNCAGMPENLIEAELFGYVKGAFTGALCDREGLLEAAKDGTVFLDEVGDMSLQMQAKLLRAIQEHNIRRVGDTEEIEIFCRFVCATHKDLSIEYHQGRFREDLYWRISTFVLEPLPLELRIKDVRAIVEHLDEHGGKLKREDKMDEFIKRLTANKLSGNVRSLQQYVRRYYVLGEMP